jgi:hypothetical protein
VVGRPTTQRGDKARVWIQEPGNPATLLERWWPAYERVAVKQGLFPATALLRSLLALRCLPRRACGLVCLGSPLRPVRLHATADLLSCGGAHPPSRTASLPEPWSQRGHCAVQSRTNGADLPIQARALASQLMKHCPESRRNIRRHLRYSPIWRQREPKGTGRRMRLYQSRVDLESY